MAAVSQEVVAHDRARELERVMKSAERGSEEIDIGSFLLVMLLVIGVFTALFRR